MIHKAVQMILLAELASLGVRAARGRVEVVQVGTAEEFKAAIDRGTPHIEITAHLDLTVLAPESSADLFSPLLAPGETLQSITVRAERCHAPNPAAHWAADRVARARHSYATGTARSSGNCFSRCQQQMNAGQRSRKPPITCIAACRVTAHPRRPQSGMRHLSTPSSHASACSPCMANATASPGRSSTRRAATVGDDADFLTASGDGTGDVWLNNVYVRAPRGGGSAARLSYAALLDWGRAGATLWLTVCTLQGGETALSAAGAAVYAAGAHTPANHSVRAPRTRRAGPHTPDIFTRCVARRRAQLHLLMRVFGKN